MATGVIRVMGFTPWLLYPRYLEQAAEWAREPVKRAHDDVVSSSVWNRKAFPRNPSRLICYGAL